MKLHYIDLFCGAGGTTTGVETAHIGHTKCADVIACVNHDPHAIASHLANHPKAHHYTEDIRTLDLSPLARLVKKTRAVNPGDPIVLWASIECTNFSRAKGGLPRDADSRTLAEHLFRYIDALDPDYIQIENVEEFMCWGELDEHGRPVSKTRGRDYVRWVDAVKSRGYDFDWRILNAANYGAYTSRKRYFGIFARKGLPIAFPEATYARDGAAGEDRSLFPSGRKPWKAVREVLDLDDVGTSIFREKPLSENTLKRIYAGLIKFVAGGKDAFLMRYNSVRPQDTVKDLDRPCGVITTENRFALTKVNFLSKQFSGSAYDKNISVDGPAGAITTRDHHAFITAYYGNGNNHSIEDPAPTVTTKDRLGYVNAQFLDKQYGTGRPAALDSPAGTVTTNPKLNLVSVKPWIMDTSFGNIGSTIDGPSRVITANRKWQYLVNPQFASNGASIDKPCFTLIARMDKRPPCIVTAEEGPAIAVYNGDSPMTVKIKEFMALYGISDITMRMLRINELKKIMGFPEDYVLVGTQTEQKKYIGNAVEVNMSRCLCEALYKKLKTA